MIFICKLPLLGGSSYSLHSLIQKLLNFNFHYFEQITKYRVFELLMSYSLFHLSQVPLIQVFANLDKFFSP